MRPMMGQRKIRRDQRIFEDMGLFELMTWTTAKRSAMNINRPSREPEYRPPGISSGDIFL